MMFETGLNGDRDPASSGVEITHHLLVAYGAEGSLGDAVPASDATAFVLTIAVAAAARARDVSHLQVYGAFFEKDSAFGNTH